MQLTSNTSPFIEAEQYSAFILTTLKDGLLGESFYRNVSDFQKGDTLNIKTVGSVTLQEGAENTAPDYTPIATGEVTLTITEYVGDAWFVTDDLREDGDQIDALMAARSVESTRAIQEKFETDFLRTGAAYYTTVAAPFTINGQPHLIPAHNVAGGPANPRAAGEFQLSQLIQARLSFDKANVPDAGRIFICDPTVESTINKKASITTDLTSFAETILKQGASSGMRFLFNLYGFDIILSNRIHIGNFDNGVANQAITGGLGNLAMCVADDHCKPIMCAWRRQPKVEGGRDYELSRNNFVAKARYGFGIQRNETMACLPTASVGVTIGADSK